MNTIGCMDYKKESGRRIRELRENRDWSLQDLSRRTKDVLSRTRIQNYEAGERMVGPHEAVILAAALGTKPAYIMGVDDIQLPITPQEEALIKNWRKLPENERMHYFRQIEQLAITWSDAHVTDAAVERHYTPRPKVIAHKRVKPR